MRAKEIDPLFDLESPYINFEKVSPSLLQALVSAFRRSELNVDVDRSTLLQTMYGINGVPGDPFNLFGDLNALGPELGMDWDPDDLTTDPLEKEAQKLENKLLRCKIATELARGAKVRTEVQQIAAQADEAEARAETTRSFLPPWKQAK